MIVPDEQAVFECGYCRVPILTFWAPDGGGMLRGEYLLAGDVVFHPRCWDAALEECPAFSAGGSERS